ncbi:MAG: hypothetical protein CL608_09920 [Anaerolineaceae bacterium]|nr:hypothetical protein [Anaerolineaceae bacterium]
MSGDLLQTKLYVPRLRPSLVPRLRLKNQLNQGFQLGHQLTLVSAPAGFGKTTLIADWGLQNLAWLSLDENDNDVARFLTYFIAALKQSDGTEPSFGKEAVAMLQSPQPPPPEAILTPLINEMSAIPDRLAIVLDDYHLIETQPIHDALGFFIENSPPTVHLVIVTREDPPLPLSRLRARDQLTELRAVDLRFTQSEAADFLNQVMGLSLSAADIAALESRTEGWITGLQLAALSLRGANDVSEFIQSFTGSNRYVLDYLIDEVLGQQPEDVQNFLLQTAVLNRLTGALCDALTGRDDGQQTLEMLDHANLFVILLDEERRWYRYHHLFSDLLRQRLRHTQPNLVQTMHVQASAWYAQHDFIDQAIEHALAGEDFTRALHLLDSEAEALWGRDEHIKLRRWLDKLPGTQVCSKPNLCVIHAWSLFATGEQEKAARRLDLAEQALGTNAAEEAANLQAGEAQPDDTRKMKQLGRIAVTRAFLAFFQSDTPAIIENSRLALELLPEDDLTWRSSAAICLGDAYSLSGQADAAYQARLEATAACQRAGNVYMRLVAGLKLAATLRQRGNLQQTIETCRQHIHLANENEMARTATTGCLYAIWGEALAEMGDLDSALEMAKKGVALTERGGDVASLGWSYLCLMRTLFSVGDFASAEEIIRKAKLAGQKLDLPPWFTYQMAVWQARVYLVQNEVEMAADCLAKHGLADSSDVSFQREIGHLVLARVLIAQGRHDEAGDLLQQIFDNAKESGRTMRAITALMLQALAFQAQGETDLALEKLERALESARPEGNTQVFVDEGQPMARLLHTAVARIAPEYVRHLLAAFPAEESMETAVSTPQVDQSDLLEPLSERELEILHKIAEGLTNPEIAERLYLSLNTVKVHTRNIYGKLDVHNRTQAVAKARELGLLPTF